MTGVKVLLAIIGLAGLVIGGLFAYVIETRAGSVLHEILAVLVVLVGVTSLGLAGVIDAVQSRDR